LIQWGMSSGKLDSRVARAAQKALDDHRYVSAIDLFLNMGWLSSAHLAEWKQGRVSSLERVVQANLSKISEAMRLLRRWAHDRGLKPSKTRYLGRSRRSGRNLQFSKSGNPAIEEAYRTHFVSPILSEEKRERLTERLGRAPDLVVFSVLTDARCDKCGGEIVSGDCLFKEADAAMCLSCADLAHLVDLPRGDAALSHRARKKSSLSAVVVRFSRSRGRYERQGLLVEDSALSAAAEECDADAEERTVRRERAASGRRDEDVALARETLPNRVAPKTGRNEPCSCGGGKKYKKRGGR